MSDDLYGYDGETPGESEAAAAANFQQVEELRAAFQQTFESDSGKRVLVFLKHFCGQTRASYIKGDPGETAYLEGRRSVVLQLMKYLLLDDEDMIRMAADRAQRGARN